MVTRVCMRSPGVQLRGQLFKSHSFFSQCGSWGSNSGPQALWRVTFLAEPSYLSLNRNFKSDSDKYVPFGVSAWLNVFFSAL